MINCCFFHCHVGFRGCKDKKNGVAKRMVNPNFFGDNLWV